MTVSIHDIDGMEQLGREAGVTPERLRAFRNAFYKKHRPADEALAVLPEAAGKAFGRTVRFGFLRLECEHRSATDRAFKCLYAADDDAPVESVCMVTPSGRATLCISSQSGCPVGCRFCGTGDMGFRRNLTADEILDQVVRACRSTDPDRPPPANVVFMGMGEPMLNPEHVEQAVTVLRDPAGFNYPGRKLLVSTCGIPGRTEAFARMFPDVCLAVSLHAPRDDLRAQLMPAARSHPLRSLRRELRAAADASSRDIMIEYVLLRDINDAEADARELAAFLTGIPVFVNLLTYNELPGKPAFRRTSPDRARRFAEILEAAGFKVTRRYSHAADIRGACGQLAGKRDSTLPHP